MDIITEDGIHTQQAERLNTFVDSIRRYLYNKCFDNDVSVAGIDCFCHEMFICLHRKKEYTFMELLSMLSNDSFLGESFNRYRIAIIY